MFLSDVQCVFFCVFPVSLASLGSLCWTFIPESYTESFTTVLTPQTAHLDRSDSNVSTHYRVTQSWFSYVAWNLTVLFWIWLLPSGGDGRRSGQQPSRELIPEAGAQRDSLHHPQTGPRRAVTSTAYQWSCDSMPRPGVREGVRVGTGQRDRTATPNTLTEERELERWRRGGEWRGRRKKKKKNSRRRRRERSAVHDTTMLE